MEITPTLIQRIQKMSEFCDHDTIAETLKIPVNIVEKVLSGKVEIDSGEKLKIVKTTEFVRNKTIGVISPVGGIGKTTILVVLAISKAINSKQPVVILDFSRTGNIFTHLGVNFSENFLGELVQHQQLKNLSVVRWKLPGILYIEGDEEKVIKEYQQKFETVFVDTDNQIAGIDTWLIITSSDVFSMPGLKTLLDQGFLNPVVVFNRGKSLDVGDYPTFALSEIKDMAGVSRIDLVLDQKESFISNSNKVYGHLFKEGVVKQSVIHKFKARFFRSKPSRLKLVEYKQDGKQDGKLEQGGIKQRKTSVLSRFFSTVLTILNTAIDLIWIIAVMLAVGLTVFGVHEYGTEQGWEVEFLSIPAGWIRSVIETVSGWFPG